MIPLGVLGSANVPATGGTPVSGTFLQAAGDIANLTTYTFASQNLGTASAGRHIVVCVACRSGGTITLSAVTVAGVSATIDVQRTYLGTTVGIVRAAVPSGTTGDIVVTFSGGAVRAAIAAYALTGGPPTVAASDAGDTSATITVPANSYAIGCAAVGGSGTYVFDSLTEDFDFATEGNLTFAGGHRTDTGTLVINQDPARVSAAVAYGP